MTDSTIFNQEQIDSPELDNTNSVDVLLKRLKDKDDFIERMKSENSEMRQKVEKSLTTEQMYQQLLEKLNKNTPPASDDQRGKPPVNESASISKEDLAKRIREVSSEVSQEERAANNLREVSDALTKAYGDPKKAAEVLAIKSKELGVSVKFLEDIARTSPKAFYLQLGITPEKMTPKSSPDNYRPVLNSEGSADLGRQNEVKPGTYKFYDDLRQTNYRLYMSPKIQNQMHTDAQEKGDAFFE